MARWHYCNVLHTGAEARHVWQFDAGGNGKFPLNREQASRSGEPLPANLVGKSWTSLWQRKLNVAWLPPENVFLRVAQFPQSSLDETRAMVELQLEKLSPIPVTQALWTLHVLPHSSGAMQTVVVTVVARSVVEEFLGELEGQGYMADRLELPMLDQVTATAITGDGAWIYPEAEGGTNTALVAWWYGGVLQNLGLLMLPAGSDRVAGLRDQLVQMAWAGELEGWLTSPPRWQLVADAATAAEWQPALREGLEQPIELVAPLSRLELAALTARRAAQTDPNTNLLPAEFATRYQQQFVDRLWLRGLGAVLAVYGVGLMIYFVALAVLNFRTAAVETSVKNISGDYTNAIRLQARYQVLKDRQELKYAALDCWQTVAESLPEGLALDSINFSGGGKLALNGTAGDAKSVLDFSDKLRKAVVRGKPLFSANSTGPPRTQIGPGGVRWGYDLELKRGEEP